MSSITIELLMLITILVVGAMFAASETALLSFKNSDLDYVKESESSVYKYLKHWLKEPNAILSTILISNNTMNIFLSALSTSFLAKHYGVNNAVLLSTLIVTLIILVFGEITPKLIAKNYSRAISFKVIRPITFFSKVFYPLVFLLTKISRIIGKILGLTLLDKEIVVTEKDIRSMIFLGNEEGTITTEKKDMLEGIFRFSDMDAGDLVIPRQNVFMLKAEDKISDVIIEIMDKGYSRVPIYEDNTDNIIGAVYVKDLVSYLYNGKSNLELRNAMREINFIPETKKALDILKEFKERKIHIAVVVDEYGGTVGVVTIEDLLEQIVGDINDEFDKEQVNIKQLEENTYLIRGDVDIEEINKETKLCLPEHEEYDSLGGFITYVSGKVPSKSEVFVHGSIEIIIKEVDKHAVKYAIVKKLPIVEELNLENKNEDLD
jgi:putative hemolysin